MSEIQTLPRSSYLKTCRAEARLLRERLDHVTTPALREKLLEIVKQLEGKRPVIDGWY